MLRFLISLLYLLEQIIRSVPAWQVARDRKQSMFDDVSK
jgi:hypothetical protein